MAWRCRYKTTWSTSWETPFNQNTGITTVIPRQRTVTLSYISPSPGWANILITQFNLCLHARTRLCYQATTRWRPITWHYKGRCATARTRKPACQTPTEPHHTPIIIIIMKRAMITQKNTKKRKKEEAFTNFWKESYYLLDFRIMFVFPWSLRSHGDVLMNGAQNGTMPLKTLPHHNTTIT